MSAMSGSDRQGTVSVSIDGGGRVSIRTERPVTVAA